MMRENYRIAAFADEAASSLEGQIKAMKENHVELLEIRGVDGENIADLSLEKAKAIRSRLDAEGLGVWSIGSPFGKIGMGEDFAPHLDKFKYCLEKAKILGADHFRLFSFYGAGESGPVLERMQEFVKASSGSGIILCHENEKGIFGENPDNCALIHETFPEIKAVFDPANFVQCHVSTCKAWERLADFVEYMHIKDALSDGSVVPAGYGEGELAFLLDRYEGEVLTVEPHLSVFEGFEQLEQDPVTEKRFVYPDSQTAFQAAVRALRILIKKETA